MSTWIRYLLCLGLWWAKTSYLCTYRYSKTQLFTALSRCKFWSFIASVLFKGLFIQSYDFDSCAKWKRFWPARLKVCVFVFSNTTTMRFSFCLNQIMYTVFWSRLACLICIAKKSIKHIFFRMYYDCTWYIKLVVAHSLDNGGTCLFCADKFNAFAEYVIVYLI